MAIGRTSMISSKDDKRFANVVVVFDVDGVLTDGSFYYDKMNKCFKKFGPDDSYALRLLAQYAKIEFASSDENGFLISQARVNDMGYQLNKVSYRDRMKWIDEYYPREYWFRIYMGDSFTDAAIFKNVDVGICPANGHPFAKEYAYHVTEHNGGDRAVADAVFFILQEIYKEDVKSVLGL